MTEADRRTDGRDRAIWRFTPRPRATPNRDDASRLRSGLEAALRAGHGAGVGFRLRLLGGPDGSFCLSVADSDAERWVEHAFLRAYDPLEWHRVPLVLPAASLDRWSGRRRGLPGERPSPPPETGRLLSSLAMAVRARGRGTSLSVTVRPAPSPSVGLFEGWWPSRAPPTRTEPFPRAGVPNVAPAVRDAPGLLWTAAVDLRIHEGSTPGAVDATLGAVRAAWSALDGRPLRLRRVRPDRPERFRSLIAETELPSFLPSRDLQPEWSPSPEGSLGIPVGRTASGAVVRLPVESDQGRHLAVLGETGMGKSSLLVGLALRLVRLGGLIVLDPLGETAATIRQELGNSGRDGLWIAPGAPSVGVNALEGIASALRQDPVRAERELEALVHALRRVRAGRYVDTSYWGPRLEEMIVRAVRAAALLPGGTLEDAHALLAKAGAGRLVVPPAAQAEAHDLLARVNARPDDAEGARRLLYEIVRNPTLARMLCQREPALSIPALVAGGRLVLVSGSASRVGESTARYLLAAYLALLWSELLARERPVKTFVLLDEAQWFAHEALAEMLRLARRCNVHVVVATQSLASLPEAVQDAVRTNVADLVIFRGSPQEALEIARITAGVPAERLLGLARGEAAVLLGKGEAVRWVRTARLPPLLGPPPERTERPGEPSARELEVPRAGELSGSKDGRGDDVLVELCARAERLAPGQLLEVDLGELNGRWPEGEAHLRALGGLLGRQGAIVRSERGPRSEGAVWHLRPEALRRALAVRGATGRHASADSQKPL